MSACIQTADDRFRALSRDPRLIALAPLFASASNDGGCFYLVGGALRDVILGRPSFDLDLATSLHPQEVINLCDKLGFKTARIGGQHQTVSILASPANIEATAEQADSFAKPIEVTTFRGAGMTPQAGGIFSKSIEEDLSYRDFTINALALELPSLRLLDPLSGEADLHAKVIRAVGEAAARFREDPLRILRMVRFLSVLGFEIEKQTLDAATASTNLLSTVSIERIRDEFVKLLLGNHVSAALRLLQRLGFFKQFIPEIESCVNFEQNRFHLAELFTHTVQVVNSTPAEPLARLAALFHDIGKPPTLSTDLLGERHFYRHESVGAEMTKNILERMRFSNGLIQSVSNLVALHMRPLNAGDAGLRRILRDVGDDYSSWRQLKEADASSCKIDAALVQAQFSEFDARMAKIQSEPSVSPLASLAIRGSDIMALGVNEGPKVGELLRQLHELVLDDPSRNNFDWLINEAKRLAG